MTLGEPVAERGRLLLAERRQRHIDVAAGDVDALQPLGMRRVARDVAGALAVADQPQHRRPARRHQPGLRSFVIFAPLRRSAAIGRASRAKGFSSGPIERDMAVLLERLDRALDLLAAAARHDQDGIAGRDDDQILHPHRRHQRAARADQAAARIDRDDLAVMRVAVGILAREIVQRIPAADIGPAHIDRHHRDPLGLLHHRIVDRDRTARRRTPPRRDAAACLRAARRRARRAPPRRSPAHGSSSAAR